MKSKEITSKLEPQYKTVWMKDTLMETSPEYLISKRTTNSFKMLHLPIRLGKSLMLTLPIRLGKSLMSHLIFLNCLKELYSNRALKITLANIVRKKKVMMRRMKI